MSALVLGHLSYIQMPKMKGLHENLCITQLLFTLGARGFFFSLGATELSGEEASRKAARKKTSGTNG